MNARRFSSSRDREKERERDKLSGLRLTSVTKIHLKAISLDFLVIEKELSQNSKSAEYTYI